MAYDFSTLDASDFELLSRDLLNRKLNLDLQSFKAGKDKGIDLRESTPENKNAIVAQGKHYLKSGFPILFADLKNTELPKIRMLKPGRYILVTSISLNPQEKDKLLDLLSPYLHSSNDIFGKEDLNKYLSELPDIETKWYKLWLTSVPILMKVLQNGLLGANEFVASKIHKTIQLYVPSPSYDIAFNILKENKYLLITGQPGVGKTTLAYYLTYNFLANGFQLLYVDTDITQASVLLSNDPTIKQIVFFDDFLGETYLEVNRPKTTESAFVLFLERIMSSENKYLILTTRTTIYNNALGKYEKLERMKVDVARREIVLDQYNVLDKARILHKHIYFADIPTEFKEEVYHDKHYWQIIEHRNYNPRLIEFITSKNHIPKNLDSSYLGFILSNLNNPTQVWRYFYQEQLNAEERILLHIVFMQTYSAKTPDTKMMFAHMLEQEIKLYNFRPGLNPFQASLKRLLDGTLKKEVSAYNPSGRVSFINPSLSDFLKQFFLESDEERHKLLNGSCTIEQFEHYEHTFLSFNNSYKDTFKEEVSWFATLLIKKYDELQTYTELKREPNRSNYIKIRTAATLSQLFKLDEVSGTLVNNFVFDAVKDYPVEAINSESRTYFCSALKYAHYGSDLYDYVKINWADIISSLFQACTAEEHYEQIKDLFDEYGENFKTYLSNADNEELLTNCLRELVDSQTSDWVSDRVIRITSESDWDNLRQEVKQKRQVIFENFSLKDDSFDEQDFFGDINIEEVINMNNDRNKDNNQDELSNPQGYVSTQDENLVREVEILFCGEYDPTFVKMKAMDMGLPF